MNALRRAGQELVVVLREYASPARPLTTDPGYRLDAGELKALLAEPPSFTGAASAQIAG